MWAPQYYGQWRDEHAPGPLQQGSSVGAASSTGTAPKAKSKGTKRKRRGKYNIPKVLSSLPVWAQIRIDASQKMPVAEMQKMLKATTTMGKILRMTIQQKKKIKEEIEGKEAANEEVKEEPDVSGPTESSSS